MSLRDFSAPATITALLGPTNTGKTHRAVRRMLAHRSGMIGLPLRLLAREVYDRVVSAVGVDKVALVTGEEKRVPATPRYWVCTVEAMPVDRAVDFLAIDEIQLAAHPSRGHAFTERLLHARGRRETWFLGSDTMAPIIEHLVPTAQLESHPRFSKLIYSGAADLSDLPRRTAVVAFSIAQVYDLAERLRRRRGGVAVVMGALSPRARNAQVALYQSGQVDFMVATDAIGMGLNMDVEHVAFASLRKFDGRSLRDLHVAELAQVAGRAGRYRTDGSFGTLSAAGEMDPGDVMAIETHRFPAVRQIYWRNPDLDMDSLRGLVDTIGQRPPQPMLRLGDRGDDHDALLRLADHPAVRSRARSPEAVRTLWEVCRVPDFRKLMLDRHVELLANLYTQLIDRGSLDPAWVGEGLDRIDRPDGDFELLMTRIAFTRTWTTIAHRPGWLEDAPRWRARAADIEARLSDALHERLTQRFVDSRVSATRMPAPQPPPRPFHQTGQGLGRIQGLDAVVLPTQATGPTTDQVQAAAEHALIELSTADDTAFELISDGTLRYKGAPVGRLAAGLDLLHPQAALTLSGGARATRQAARERLERFARDRVAALLAPLHRKAVKHLSPHAQGLVVALRDALGTVRRADVSDMLQGCTRADQTTLARLDVRVGQHHIYVGCLLKPARVADRVALWRAFRASPPFPAPTTVSFTPAQGVGADVLRGVGYPPFGPIALRADVAEKVSAKLRGMGRRGPFEPPAEIGSWLGAPRHVVPEVVTAMGFRCLDDGRLAPPHTSGPRRHHRRRR